jgi:GntR family transcriptional regulator, transcriptional repressor for pyruvate dehydrogenase complex
VTDAVSASFDAKSLGPIIEAVREIVAENGSMPSERAIAQQLQVKRHKLRRALETLRASGELEPARAGRRAAPDLRLGGDLASGTNPIEIIELRTVLEPALARLAALRASPSEIGRIQRATVTPADTEPGSVDLAFHRAVAAGSRNSLATEFYSLLRHVARDARLRLGATDENRRCPKRIAERDAEHAAIAEAIAGRDPDAAERAMREHLMAVQRQILARLSPGSRTT